jgi:hypothetical protein
VSPGRAQQREAGLGIETMLAGPLVRRLGRGVLTPQAVSLAGQDELRRRPNWQ